MSARFTAAARLHARLEQVVCATNERIDFRAARRRRSRDRGTRLCAIRPQLTGPASCPSRHKPLERGVAFSRLLANALGCSARTRQDAVPALALRHCRPDRNRRLRSAIRAPRPRRAASSVLRPLLRNGGDGAAGCSLAGSPPQFRRRNGRSSMQPLRGFFRSVTVAAGAPHTAVRVEHCACRPQSSVPSVASPATLHCHTHTAAVRCARKSERLVNLRLEVPSMMPRMARFRGAESFDVMRTNAARAPSGSRAIAR